MNRVVEKQRAYYNPSMKSSLLKVIIGLILCGSLAATVSVHSNLRAMEQNQIQEFQTMARNIRSSMLRLTVQGGSDNLFDFVQLLSQMPNIQYVGYWAGGRRVLQAGRAEDLDAGLLAAPKENAQGLRSGRYVYFCMPFLLTEPVPARDAGYFQIVFSLESFLARKNNIIAASVITGAILVGLVAALLLLMRLQEKLSLEKRRRSEMTSAISHDAQSYLTVIQGKIDNLLFNVRRRQALDNPSQPLLQVKEHAELLSGFFRNICETDEPGRIVVMKEPVAPDEVVAAVVGSLEEAGRRKRVQMVFEPASHQFQLQADPKQLRRILHNLLQNAIKFSPPDTAIRVRTACDQGVWSCWVRDSGPGIPAAEAERIFERWVRLQKNTPGSGLGLFISRQLARLMGGEVCLEQPDDGQGACFKLTLPMEKAGPC